MAALGLAAAAIAFFLGAAAMRTRSGCASVSVTVDAVCLHLAGLGDEADGHQD